jgi:hypothetical protein
MAIFEIVCAMGKVTHCAFHFQAAGADAREHAAKQADRTGGNMPTTIAVNQVM